MTVTINKMSAGKSYEYLLRDCGRGRRGQSLSTPLTRYYTEAGTPPGRWMGSGVDSLETAIQAGDEVTEEQLKLRIGRALTRRRASRSVDDTATTINRSQASAATLSPGHFTFSIPQSASVLWGFR